jgi:Ca2+-binding EF-hand superfamily protein
MGNQQYQNSHSQSSHTQWSSPKFEQFSGINPSRLSQINEEFHRAAGSDGLVSRQEFDKLYGELNIGSNQGDAIDRAFRAFDQYGSGKLSFNEFVSATVMLNNNTNTRERIDFLIDSNHPNGSDNIYITPDYGRSIIHNLNQFYGADADFDDIWSRFNTNNGQVNREEFVTYISQAPAFVRYF